MVVQTIQQASVETGISVSTLLCAIERGELTARASKEFDGGYITTRLHLASYLNHSLDEYLSLLKSDINPIKYHAEKAQNKPIDSVSAIQYQEEQKSSNSQCKSISSEVALDRLGQYLKLSNYEKGELTKTYIEQITSEFTLSMPNYVDLHELSVVPVKQRGDRYRLDLRSKDSNFEKLLGAKRIRLDKEATTLSAARIAANKLIHENLMASGKTAPLTTELTPSQGMAMSVYNQVHRKLTRKEIKPQTTSDKISKVAMWYHVFEGIELSQISQELVDDLIDEFFLHECDGSTINKYMVELRLFVEYAHCNTTNIEPIYIPSFQSSGREFKDIPYSKLMKMIPIYTNCIIEQLGIELGYWIGMRFTNLWNDFLISNLKLRDTAQPISIRNFSYIEIPGYRHKNQRKVTIPLSEQAEIVIRKLLASRRSLGITHPNLLALNNEGKTFVRNPEQWKHALEQAELDTSIVFHHFRHYRAKRMLETNRSFNTVRQALGLASEKMVELFYGHISVSDDAIQAMDESTVFDILDAGTNLNSLPFKRTEVADSQCSTKSRILNTGSVSLNSATAANEFASTAAPKKQRRRKLNK